MEDNKVYVTNEDGKKIEGEALFTFEANGDDFVLYEIEGEVFAAKIDEEDNLRPVEEDEWKLVEKVYNQYMEEIEGEDDDGE